MICVFFEDFVLLDVMNRKFGNLFMLKLLGWRGRGMDELEGEWRRILGLEELGSSLLRGMEVKDCSVG